MGMYLNPGNSGFEEIRNSRYVDKSGLISLVNRSVNAVVILSVSSTCCSFVKRYDVRITMVPKMSYDSEYSKVLSNLSLVEQFSILPDCLKKTFDFIKIHALICWACITYLSELVWRYLEKSLKFADFIPIKCV